jgi:type III pantothenate kinase
MKLLLDIGNSRLKVATVSHDGLTLHAAIALTSFTAIDVDIGHPDPAGLAPRLSSLRSAVSGCLASSVADQGFNERVQQRLAPLRVQWVRSSTTAAGVTNAYPDPAQLGVDRWVAMLGLKQHFGAEHPPIVLANFGTATTVDTLSPDNRFEGGLIVPGITMMHDALARGTAHLPSARGEVQDFPTSTISAISSGVSAAQIGAVARQLALAQRRFGQTPLLCVSGGACAAIWPDLINGLPNVVIHELPHVVLEGLALLARIDE